MKLLIHTTRINEIKTASKIIIKRTIPSSFRELYGCRVVSVRSVMGNPRTKYKQNIFDPKAFDIAIFPSPWRATIIDENKLGMVVPEAPKVSPIAMELTPIQFPSRSNASFMAKQSTTNQVEQDMIVSQ